MPVRLSYINARNEEVILDDDENSFAHELVGRTGMEMPQIETEVVTYGDGSQDIVLSRLKSRTVTCYFWVDLDNKIEFERHLREVKSQLLQVGSRMGNWGKLKVRRTDGTYLYLNCIYKSGLDAMVRDGNVRLKFSLSFEATDPLFYNGFETKYVIQPEVESGYLMMEDFELNGEVVSYLDYDFSKDKDDDGQTEGTYSALYMLPLTDPINDNAYANPDSVYMASAGLESSDEVDLDSQKVYPTITITGSAANIRLINELTGRKIEFDPSIVVDGENYVLIETKPLHKKAVQVNSSTGVETSIMGKITADSNLDFYLERGTNVIRFRNSESQPNSKCTFTYTEGFLTAE